MNKQGAYGLIGGWKIDIEYLHSVSQIFSAALKIFNRTDEAMASYFCLVRK
jgi:hypothetical protein